MESTISSIVPILLENKPSSKTISLGPIAQRLVECVQAIHECNNIIRDVKVENFMLAHDDGKGGSTVEKKLASRIRLIDLAMATQFTSMYSDDKTGSGINGTPLYASLNVHDDQKSSYRDDLEALGYVIAELLLQLSSGDSSKQLPWSHGSSDEEIGALKKSFVEDKKSSFYTEMGNAKTVQVFSTYMDAVRSLGFKKRPDYAQLADGLSKLTFPRPQMVAPKPTTSKKATKSPRRAKQDAKPAPSSVPTCEKTKRTRSTRNSTKTDEDEIEEISPPKVARRNKSTTMDVDTEENSGPKPMDWEYTDENEEPQEDKKPRARGVSSRGGERVIINERASRRQKNQKTTPEVVTIDDKEDKAKKSTSKPLKRVGVKLVVIDGPHKGESMVLESGGTEMLVLGSNPSSKIGTTYAFKKDKSIQATHVVLELDVGKKMTTVRLTDKSKGNTYKNRETLRVLSTKVFINDTIRIGDTMINIAEL